MTGWDPDGEDEDAEGPVWHSDGKILDVVTGVWADIKAPGKMPKLAGPSSATVVRPTSGAGVADAADVFVFGGKSGDELGATVWRICRA